MRFLGHQTRQKRKCVIVDHFTTWPLPVVEETGSGVFVRPSYPQSVS